MPPKAQNSNGSDGPSNSRSSISEGATEASTSQSQPGANSVASTTVLPKMSDANAISPSPAVSQPMSKSNSAGSNPSSKDAGAEKASPYGTRSRNRTGTSRPNYAEDKDIDMELFEMYPERREDETKKSTRLANSSTNGSQDAPPRSTGGTSRRPLPTDGRQSSSQMHSKDQNSTPSAAATPASNSTATSQPSKKRKAASQAATSGGHSHAGSHSHAPASSTTRKSAAAAASQNGLGYSETNLLTFDDCKGRPVDGKLVADDGTVLEVNDHVYLVCEPPGEPYYIGRVMEFLHAKNDPSKPIDALRVNWYYRPRDIGRKVQDTRAVFATMHSDTSPLTALRGKCQIKHKAEIANLDEYRKTPDCFWFEKLYDRYIQKNYEVIPTFQIVNVPERVKKVLDERWKYILVEQGRGKELTSAVKLCKRCSGYCASNDSVDCAVCKNTYHMNCVRPPLLKKPSRGFAWSCAACSRAQERKLEARNTPNLADPHLDAEEEELLDEEEEEACAAAGTGRTSPSDGAEESHPPATAEQIYHASLWPYRYLGIHCKVEDALDYDDRIYPRAATRIGPRYQAVVQDWPGRPVKYEKPAEIKKGNRRDKTVQAALEAEKIRRAKRPKWVQDEPAGYVHRGEDLDNGDPNCTSTLLYKTPEGVSHREIDRYMDKARALTATLGLPERSTNLEDVAMNTLFKNNFDFEKALKEIPKVDRSAFKEPELSPTELKRFEEGVSKYGSELYAVMKHIKSVKTPTVVRHYYTWKKTERGKQIWGSYSGRKGKKDNKEAKKAEHKVTDDVADDQDDSAFDTGKAVDKKRQFTCKFCNTKSSRQWRRAPNVATPIVTEGATGKNGKGDKGSQYVVALCRRCAELWRRYAVQWEDIEALAQKVATTGGRVLKRKVDEELVKELMAADDRMRATVYSTPDPYEATATPPRQSGSEPPRKKLKGHPDRDTETNASDSGVSVAPARKREKAEKAAPPPAPEMPKPKTLPCAICRQMEPLGDQHLSCRECRLTVHRNCYGVLDNRNPGKWICDMCANDKAPQISIDYRCVLCPVEHTEHDFVDMPPKSNSKKKTDKEKEKEKQERETAQKAAEFYRKRQEDLHRPVNPREPLKRTADNNWVHVTCAVWTPEVKFGKAKALEPSEGIPLIPRAKYAEVCKACGHAGGACVACHQCRAPVHVECAHREGYVLGFDITPVKGSRRDQVNIVSLNGESGAMTAAVWCKDHVPQKSIVHRMDEPVDDTGMNALQLYVQNYKQADLTLTGCARKANLITLGSGSRATNTAQLTAANRRASTTTVPANGASTQSSERQSEEGADPLQPGGKICLTCGVDSSPKWYPIDKERERELVNGYHGSLGVEAQKFVAQRNFQCHKCKKLNRKPKSTPTPTPKKEPSPPLVFEPLRPLPQTAMHATSPQVTASESRSLARSSYSSWTTGAAQPTQPPLAAPLQAAGPGPAPGPPAPAQPPALAPSIAPRAPPPPSHGYPPPSREPFSDWHRPPAHHSQTQHTHINGGPPPAMAPSVIPPLAPPNHLRPPPISSLNHGPPPPPPQASMPNGHLSQPHMNGVPPSPRRMSGPPPPPPPMSNGGAYMHTYHHQVPHPPHALTNGGPPPRPPERPYTQTFQPAQQPQRSPFTTPHGSPPMPMRDALTSLREPSNPPPPRGGDGRPASGASASPSLANLLS